jgi:hypothetical protein
MKRIDKKHSDEPVSYNRTVPCAAKKAVFLFKGPLITGATPNARGTNCIRVQKSNVPDGVSRVANFAIELPYARCHTGFGNNRSGRKKLKGLAGY